MTENLIEDKIKENEEEVGKLKEQLQKAQRQTKERALINEREIVGRPDTRLRSGNRKTRTVTLWPKAMDPRV